MKQTLMAIISVFMLATQVSWSQIPQTMSYQGILTDDSSIVVPDGTYSLTFSLYDIDTGGTALWSETHASVPVDEGMFNVILGSVAPLNIAFDVQYWLEVEVNSAVVSPRVSLTSSPYSLNAQSVADGQVVRSINGKTDAVTLAEGANITITPNGNTLSVSSSFDGWSLTGNAGTNPDTNFLGTTDDRALELRVNNLRVLRLEPPVIGPNIIGGYKDNWIADGVYGATIFGGGYLFSGCNCVTDRSGTVSGGMGNQAGDNAGSNQDASNATVGGGFHNTASGFDATVGGGHSNTASNTGATVGGGESNAASGNSSTVGGGFLNNANADAATIGGGALNITNDDYSTIGGGFSNSTSGQYATIAGGGCSNPDDINSGNHVTDDYGTIGGGGSNRAGDGAGTTEDATYCTVGGGFSNIASYHRATVGGGSVNLASSYCSTVGGGTHNIASDGYATVGGGRGNRASAKYATVAGGGTSVAGDSATSNHATDDYCTVGGGGDNQAGDDDGNTGNATYATVGGGKGNAANGAETTIGGGIGNNANGNAATIGGGAGNYTESAGSTVGGGEGNSAIGSDSTVPGGYDNTAQGDYSFAAGRQAKALHDGCFVWSDSTEGSVLGDVTSRGDNQFIVRAYGGTYIHSGESNGFNWDYTGVLLSPGESAWSTFSDRQMKRNIRPVDGKVILYKLANIPISRWSYKAQDSNIEHIGPMAQDFYSAFCLGVDDRHISTVDPDGVALAAIQGLYELVKEKDIRIAAQEKRISDLEARLAALEAMVSSEKD